MAILIIIITTIYFSFDKHKWKDRSIIGWDVCGYYNYLPATFIYHDIGQMNFIDTIDSVYALSIKEVKRYGSFKIENTNKYWG